ncbi:MAG TPA: metal ABC transporter substrate-binding protein [Candidatus Binatia bacterium]|jgi:ABC-type Zn uptake system ZnuABC Zn-binding protein ZnuA
MIRYLSAPFSRTLRGTAALAAALAILTTASSAHAKLEVVATLPDLASIARDIGGDAVNVTCIGKPNEDPHYVQAKPSFIVTLNKADVLIENGLELEIGWLPALVDQTRNDKIRVGAPGRIVAADGVPLLDIPTEAVTRAMGDVHPGGNPHFSIDPENGKIMAKNIAAGLALADPSHASAYNDNLAKLLARIDAAEADCLKVMAPFKGTKVVTYHKSLTYFCQRFGLVEVGTVEPKPGIPPSASHVTELIALIKNQGVKVILMEPWHERRTPDTVAEQTGAKVVEFPAQVGGDPAITDYPSLCGNIVPRIAAALR